MTRKKTTRKKEVSPEDQWFNGIKKDYEVVESGRIGYEIVARFVVVPEDTDIIRDVMEYLQQYGAAEITSHKIF